MSSFDQARQPPGGSQTLRDVAQAGRRPAIDPTWWDSEQVDGVTMRRVLAERDIKTVFQFLHRRGWSWSAIAQATDIGEQRVREIAGGKRRIENYDVYVRVAVGLNIPRDYLGVGIRPIDEPAIPAVLAGTVAGQETHDTVDEMTTTLKNAIERVTPAEVSDRGKPDLHHFEAQVIQAWAERRHTSQRETTLILVAGFAGSGNAEFARFLSGVTGWALLDKDVLTRPMVESMLTTLHGDPKRPAHRAVPHQGPAPGIPQPAQRRLRQHRQRYLHRGRRPVPG